MKNKKVIEYSNLMQEWDWEKNNQLNLFPENLSSGSNKKVWWRCENGHSWNANINHRVNGQNCPYCSNRKVLVGYNDLKTLYPDIVAEWDYTKNLKKPEQYVVGSAQIVWWKCSKCGCEWETSIRQRTQRRTGCPFCAKGKIVKKRKQTFLDKKGSISSPILLEQWNYDKNGDLSPQDLTEGSGQAVWWKCPKCGYEWKTRILSRKSGKIGCPCCSNKVAVRGINDLATTHPEIAKEWDYEANGEVLPTNVTYGQGKKVHWICPKGHKYQATILHRTSGTNCPVCNSGRQTSFAEQAFFFYIKKIHPDAVNRYTEIFNNRMELDIYIPSIKTAIEYDGIFWHKNKRKKEEEKYRVCQNNGIKLIRIRESADCDSRGIADACYHIDSMDNIQSLENLIVLFLNDLEKFNENYLSHPLEVNLKRDNLEIRKYMTELKNNSLADVRPDLADEWYYEKNGDLTPKMFLPYSSQKVWWKCKICGNIWRTTINSRAKGARCLNCYRRNNKGTNHVESKQIYQYSITGEFIKKWGCISEACRVLKINSSNVSMSAKHQRRVAGGFRWEYFYVEKLEPIIPIKKRQKGSGGKKILQINVDGNIIKEYKSLNEASETLHIDASSISKVLHGHSKKAGGFFWKFK